MPSSPPPPPPPPPATTPTTHTLNPLASCTPPSTSRAWQSMPHPYLPLLASASSDKTVRIYSLRTFAQLSTITGGHKRSVRCVAWKPGLKSDRESVLGTGSFDATAGIWRGENARRRIGGVATASENVDGEQDVEEEELEEDDNEDGDDDYAFAVILEGHDSEIKSLSFSPHGTYLATCSRDKSIWIWEHLVEDGGDEDNFETVAVLQEHEGDVKCVAWRPGEEGCVASGSYDESLRIWREDADGEWGCVGIGNGHEGTVWGVCWEPEGSVRRWLEWGLQGAMDGDDGNQGVDTAQPKGIKPSTPPVPSSSLSGPRLLSCSADLTIRLWRRKPKPPPPLQTGPRIPSIIRSSSDEEEWYEEAQLPQRHERAVYSVAWSEVSARVVSCGGDGRIVVYEEESVGVGEDASRDVAMGGVADDANGADTIAANASGKAERSRWRVIAELEAAHGIYEINHVCWARRADRDKTADDEEIVVSTGDDGQVRVWTVDAT